MGGPTAVAPALAKLKCEILTIGSKASSIVRIRFDRAYFGTDRQNSFRSSWLWNRSSEFVSIKLALEPIVRIRFDRAYFGTDRQNSFRSSSYWPPEVKSFF